MATLSGWNKREAANSGQPTRGMDVNQMQKELEDYKEQLEAAKNEIKVQQGKNDDLRSKNWKAMEALSNMERMYQKNAKTNNTKKQSNQPKTTNNNHGANQNSNLSSRKNRNGRKNSSQNHDAVEQAQKTFLVQLFDDVIDVSDGVFENKSHKEWLDTFSDKIKSWKSDLEQGGGANNNDANALDEELKDALIVKVENLKRCFSEAEGMLHQVQLTVEIEENRWKIQLSKKENEIEILKEKIRNMDVENSSLKASLQEAGLSMQALETEIEVLKKNLEEEESKRKEMSTLLTQTIQTKATENLNLLKEVDVLKSSLENEKNGRGELETKVLQMNQMINLGKKALQQEKIAVDLLKQQIFDVDNKTKIEAANVTPNYENTASQEKMAKEDGKEIDNPKIKNAFVTIDDTKKQEENSEDTSTATTEAQIEIISEKDVSVEEVDPSKAALTAPKPQNKSTSRNNTLKKKKKKNKHVF